MMDTVKKAFSFVTATNGGNGFPSEPLIAEDDVKQPVIIASRYCTRFVFFISYYFYHSYIKLLLNRNMHIAKELY